MKPYIYTNDQDETIIEWIGADERFGLCFDQTHTSSWFYVNKAGAMECGDLTDELLDALGGASVG
jgi:hypothetical protein